MSPALRQAGARLRSARRALDKATRAVADALEAVTAAARTGRRGSSRNRAATHREDVERVGAELGEFFAGRRPRAIRMKQAPLFPSETKGGA